VLIISCKITVSSTLAITLEGYPIFLRLLAPNITQKHVQHSPPYAEITAYQCIYMQMNESHYAYRTSWIHTIFMRWNLHTESTPSSIIHITHTHSKKRKPTHTYSYFTVTSESQFKLPEKEICRPLVLSIWTKNFPDSFDIFITPHKTCSTY